MGTDLTRTHDSPFVGREIDLALLKGIFDKTVAADSAQLVTVVGEPGLGKSRIVAELFALRRRPGRSPSRGGRAAACRTGKGSPSGRSARSSRRTPGSWSPIRPGRHDEARRGAPRRRRSAPGSASGCCRCSGSRRPPRPSARSCSRPGGGSSSRSPSRTRPCSCSRTCTGPTRPCSRSSSTWPTAPRACRCSSSAPPAPSSSSATPSYAAGFATRRRSASRRSRRRRPPGSSRRCWRPAVLPAELQQPILDRAGGNPLYAEEFVRLLKDRDLLVRKGASWELREGAEVPFPDSVQAADRRPPRHADPGHEVAARRRRRDRQGLLGRRGRRDGRARPRRSSPDACASCRGRSSSARRAAPRSRARPSTPSGTSSPATSPTRSCPEPRGRLAPRGRRGVDRVQGTRARRGPRRRPRLPLRDRSRARARRRTDRAGGRAEAPALTFLALAGERALGLDTAAALANLERALALAPARTPRTARALARFAEAAHQAGRNTRGEREALEEAIASFGSGRPARPARAMGTLARCCSRVRRIRGQSSREAVALLEPLPPGPELVARSPRWLAAEMLQGRGGGARADRALALAAELGLDRPARALGYRGCARASATREARRHARGDRARDRGRAGTRGGPAPQQPRRGDLVFEGPGCTRELSIGIAYAKARGLTEMADWATAGTLSPVSTPAR